MATAGRSCRLCWCINFFRFLLSLTLPVRCTHCVTFFMSLTKITPCGITDEWKHRNKIPQRNTRQISVALCKEMSHFDKKTWFCFATQFSFFVFFANCATNHNFVHSDKCLYRLTKVNLLHKSSWHCYRKM